MYSLYHNQALYFVILIMSWQTDRKQMYFQCVTQFNAVDHGRCQTYTGSLVSHMKHISVQYAYALL